MYIYINSTTIYVLSVTAVKTLTKFLLTISNVLHVQAIVCKTHAIMEVVL